MYQPQDGWSDPLQVAQHPPTQPPPPTLEDEVNHLYQLVNHQQQRIDQLSNDLQAANSRPVFDATPSAPPFAPTAPRASNHDTVSLPSDTPMDINAIRSAERARRKAENLCFWCGEDHRVRNCPTAPEDVRNKARVKVV